jgi:hypothetical protein
MPLIDTPLAANEPPNVKASLQSTVATKFVVLRRLPLSSIFPVASRLHVFGVASVP